MASQAHDFGDARVTRVQVTCGKKGQCIVWVWGMVDGQERVLRAVDLEKLVARDEVNILVSQPGPAAGTTA